MTTETAMTLTRTITTSPRGERMSTPIPANAPVRWRKMHEHHPAIEPGRMHYLTRSSRPVMTWFPAARGESYELDDPGVTVWIEGEDFPDSDDDVGAFEGWNIGGCCLSYEELGTDGWWIDLPVEEK